MSGIPARGGVFGIIPVQYNGWAVTVQVCAGGDARVCVAVEGDESGLRAQLVSECLAVS